VLHILGFSLPGNALFLTTAFFLEAIKRPMPAVVVIVAANLLNAGLNLLLVFGEPALGAVGSAVATSAARWFMALALIAYVLLMPGHGVFAVRAKVARWWADSATARQIGYASGVSSALEASAFGSMTIFAGWFGASILAAYAIALNAWSLVFMSAIGLGIGAAVRVGHAAGAGDRPAMREAGWVALVIAFIVMTPISVSFDVFRDELAAIFTTDPILRADSAAMLAMCAWVILMDSGKTVMLQAVRGTGDTWVPTRAQFVLVFGVMVPSAYVLAFPLGFGPAGLFLGMLAAPMPASGPRISTRSARHFNAGFSPQDFTASLVLQADALRFKPATRVENACATGSAAVHQAGRPRSPPARAHRAGRRRRADDGDAGPEIGNNLLKASYLQGGRRHRGRLRRRVRQDRRGLFPAPRRPVRRAGR
jgi:putative MATE family efflux protein